MHRRLLDAFGRHGTRLDDVRGAWTAWREAEARHAGLAAEVERASREESCCGTPATSSSSWRPSPARRPTLAEAAPGCSAPREAVAGDPGCARPAARPGCGGRAARWRAAHARAGDRHRPAAFSTRLDGPRSGRWSRCDEAASALERAGEELDLERGRLERVEERLFALRAAARKHRVTVDGLPSLREELAARLAGIDDRRRALEKAAEQATAARSRLRQGAATPVARRARPPALALGRAVMAELPPLKLDKARFGTCR